MPTFQYEAMDNSGLEVKDTIEAGSEAEAQAKIKEKGYFVTRIVEKGKPGKKTKDGKTKQDPKTQADAKKKAAAAAKKKKAPVETHKV